jgi:protoporphyrinogen oxidase
MTADLIVLGAGPAGLGAAYKAAGNGHKVVVLEKADRVGGAAGSFEVGGQRVDVGSHRLHPSVDPEILNELRSLLGADLQMRVRNGRMRIAGRWVRFPLKVGDALRNLPSGLTARLARDVALAPTRKPHADSYEEVLRAKLGPALCESFYFPFARKVWGLEPSEISGEQARKRVSADSLLAVAARAIRGSKEGGSEGAGHFLYPRRGYGQISEALAGAAAARGAEIHLGSTVSRVRLDDSLVNVETEAGESHEGRMLFSSVPVTGLVRLASPEPPSEVVDAASHLTFRSMLLVYLVVERARYTEFDAHYFPEEWTPVTRVSEPKNYRNGDDPQDKTVLCAEIPCTRGDELWESSEVELGDMARAALIGAGLPNPDPVDIVVRRLPFAYPVYDLDYKGRFDVVDAWAGARPRLITFGRQGLFVHDNAHHALAMAWAAAECLREDGSFDASKWRAARERFATHVVED